MKAVLEMLVVDLAVVLLWAVVEDDCRLVGSRI